MDTDIFLSKIDGEKGLTPLHRFVARFKMPSLLAVSETEILTYLCDSATMPGKKIATSE